MQEIQVLHERLDLLLKKYNHIQRENERLKQTISRQLKDMDVLNARLAALEENMLAKHLAANNQTPEQNRQMRKQIDTVIAEIDKILQDLHD